MRMSNRDVRLLTWIGEQIIVNKVELEALIHRDYERYGAVEKQRKPGVYVVRDMVKRWRSRGIVDTIQRTIRGNHIFLTADGMRVTGLDFPHKTPGHNDIAILGHHDAVNRLRIHLENRAYERGEELHWVSERRLLQEEQLEVNPATNKRYQHRPDGVVLTIDQESGERVETAIEVELTPKKATKLDPILQSYIETSAYDFVFYYYKDEKVKRALDRGLERVLHEKTAEQSREAREKIVLFPIPFDDA